MAAASPLDVDGCGEGLLEPDARWPLSPGWKSLETLWRDEVDLDPDWVLWTLLECC